ncbi:pentatricopeptide repeat-containing protein At1g09190 [Aristolochia californica]|uniref:pentatricopeptide repeat-containing protein At1g09190 n=1 Tax=Aristolochia californica TaxID=171875 RepID=UPI0035DEF065
MSRSCGEVERQLRFLLHGRRSWDHLIQIHARILRHDLHWSNLLLAQFVLACAFLRKMAYASVVFLQTQNPNILLFNSMFKAYSLMGPRKEPLQLLSSMRNRGIWPDQYTYAPLLKSCSNLRDIVFGRRVHAEVLTLGFECHSSIGIALVEFYVSCGKMEDATRMFDLMSHREPIVWNLIIRGFCKAGDVKTGFRFFQGMDKRTVVSWNSMMTEFSQSGHDHEALDLFREMWNKGLELDDATLVIILPVCARLGAVDIGRWAHSYADSKGLSKVIAVGNSLIDMYAKCGDLDSARKVFDKMAERSIVSWNSMITGLALNGIGEAGIDLFEEMKSTGVKPNEVTFLGVLGCCTHAGLVKRGSELFNSMTEDHQVEPKLEHYGCMVDLLGRNGCVKEAYDFIKRMPILPSAAIWGALLSACKIQGDSDVAGCAAKELIDLEPWNSGNYVLLSNIYAEAGRWDDVKKIRILMREKCVSKAPGESVIGLIDKP